MEKLGQDSKRFFEKGITLIEGLISTVIVGIGFIAVFQMVNYSVQSIDVSGERTKGTYLVGMVAEDLLGNSQAERSSQKFVDILVNNSKQDSSTGDKQSWGSNSCSAGANLNSNFTNIIDKKLDKWNNRFSERRLKCRKDGTGTREKKFLKVFDICPSGCRFKNDKVFDKMYIAKFQIFLNNGEKDKFIYFPVHVEIKP